MNMSDKCVFVYVLWSLPFI